MRRGIQLIALILALSVHICIGQNRGNIEQVVYLIGNTATREINDLNFTSLHKHLEKENNPFTILHLGDIIPQENTEDWDQAMDPFFDLTEGLEHGRVLFTQGDKDWDNSGRNGLKNLRKLEKTVEKRQKENNIFLPSEGCPGPEVFDVSRNLRLVFINTQWWLHPYDIPEAPDADCSNLTKEEFMEALEEVVEESAGRNILIVGHHPLVSSGVYGGHMTAQKHLFPFADGNKGRWIPAPVLGSFYAAFRQNVGTVRDMASEDYQDFIDHMSDLLTQHPGLVYASAHDYNLQLLEYEKGYQIVSGSINERESTGHEPEELFVSSNHGFTRLEYHSSGHIRIGFFEAGPAGTAELFSRDLFLSACDQAAPNSIPRNRFYIPCAEEEMPGDQEDHIPFPDEPVIVTGGSYPARGMKKVLLGSLHRDTWQTPVAIPYLNLDTTKLGLTPFALGGGRQTTTVKFRAGDGKEYAFRSVDKNLVNALPRVFRKTFVASLIKEVTATEYPYGAIIASSLLDETDILHARPKLYVLPDHPDLGAFRENYAGLFGMLEIRPKDPYGEIEGFAGADDVTRSVGLFRKLYRDNDNRVDAEALGKARVFDMLIGDWGRHEDNWKWAGFDREDKRIYYPIPRDRDHAFCRWNGLIPYIADREWAMPMVESFDADFHDIKSLTWPARHVDRLLLTDLDHTDWKRISTYVETTMTDQVIDNAISTLPPEILPVSGLELGEMLKSRREQLPGAVDKYYSLLAREVDVVGSNKHELVEVKRLGSGNVQVDMYKRNKEGREYRDYPLFSREFDRNETREISIYGLDGEDVFKISGSSDKSIKVRIIGGPGKDEISDISEVDGYRKHTLVYDTESTGLNLGSESRDKTSNDPGINLYDRKSFAYNTYLPVPLVFYSSDDGIVGSLGLNWTTHAFRKGEYQSKNNFYLRAGTVGNVQFGLESHWKNLMGSWNGGLKADYGFYYPYYNFFGLGNNTVKDPDLFDAEYYRVNVRGLLSSIYTEKEFLRKGIFRLGLLFENLDSEAGIDSILVVDGQSIPGSERVTLGGINTRIYLDFRDRQIFATRGLQFLAENSLYSNLNGSSGTFGLAETYLKYFGTVKIGIPVTLVVKAGGSKNYGEEIPYYKYTFLGQFSNLRGYKRNRFTGDASTYINTEIRLHLGRVRSLILPFETGLIGFYDAGRVWLNGTSEGDLHAGYGAGFYISPITRDYLVTFMLESSIEERLLFRFGFGFMLDD
jgi:hypothetical protein